MGVTVRHELFTVSSANGLGGYVRAVPTRRTFHKTEKTA
jgi:hypothetical protein